MTLSTGARAARWGAAVVGALVIAAAVAVAVTRDSSDPQPRAVAKTTTSTTTTTAVVTTTEPETGPVAPLTGLRVTDPALVNRPALVAKIDNLDAPKESALPQAGLARADVVFEEIVEGNITRLVGVFHSQSPGRVGPIRSARTTDVHLLPQLGRVLFAWSGGNAGVVGAVHRAWHLIDLGHDAASPAYSRDRSRRAPHNLFVETGQLWERAPGDATPPHPLFQYRTVGQAQPDTAERAQGVDLTWGGGVAASPVSWRWDAKNRVYLRSQNGRPHNDADGTRLMAKNVVVLVTEYGRSAADSRSPEALSVGSGEAFIYTDGWVLWGRWERTAEDQPAKLVDSNGDPILLSPGQTWIELPRSNSVSTVR